ncbi:MAG: NUDIX domain-containing protein [Burkholderiales bacterium]|nr:NUDIX domain-containing protein [Burkholderiales bacterium]
MPREFAADNTAYGWRQSARDRLAYLAFAGSLLNRFISSRVLLLLALCSMAAPVAAEEDFVAAGILLASQNQQPTMIFLVKHHSRLFYEMPGGRRQLISSPKGERRETAYETAIRECIEETRGHLSASLLQERVDPSRYLRDHGFVFFFGKIHRFTLSELGELSNSGGERQ